ncbi:MAG: YkgJ family cysteine cluster protein [Candidatus Omnitrophota bacterium]
MKLKQLIPEEYCLKCDVCCRFVEPHSIWSPLFTNSEINYLVEKDILPPLVFTTHPDTQKNNPRAQRINLIQDRDIFICPCFNSPDNRCKIYIDRPFECRLYPFLLTKKEGQIYLAIDKKCPYLNSVEEDKIKSYTGYLKRELKKPEAISFVKQIKDLFLDYPPKDLEFLFSINAN